MNDDLAGRIKELRSWWKSSTEVTFLYWGNRLKEIGMEDDDIVELLEDMHNAVSEEYGN
jgi:hypothetical protein